MKTPKTIVRGPTAVSYTHLLYAAGPILSAAVDGEGVLSGNELTEAVVFGSTAGTEAAVYVSDNQ